MVFICNTACANVRDARGGVSLTATLCRSFNRVKRAVEQARGRRHSQRCKVGGLAHRISASPG